MAKFTGKNIEFQDYQKAIFGTADDAELYWNDARDEMIITTVISGVDPTDPGHLTTRRYFDTNLIRTIIGLDDTPDDYEVGSLLLSTYSGVEWTTISGLIDATETYFEVIDSTGGQTVNTTASTINLDKILFNSDLQTGANNFSLASDEITVNSSEYLFCSYKAVASLDSGVRDTLICWLEEYDGFVWTVVSGSYSYGYTRGTYEYSTAATNPFMLDVTAGYRYRLRCNTVANPCTLISYGSSITFFSFKGPRGIKGEKGDVGDIGDKGDKGDQGDQGVQGVQGPPGAGTNINVYKEDVTVSGSPFEVLNFKGFNYVENTSSGIVTISGVDTFTELRDTPESYSVVDYEASPQYVRIRKDGTGLEFGPAIVGTTSTGTTPPIDSNLWYNAVYNEFFYYDPNRAEWLSLTVHNYLFTYQGIIDGLYMSIGDLRHLSAHYHIPRPATITAIISGAEEIYNSGKSFDIIDGNGPTTISGFTHTDWEFVDMSANIPLDIDTKLQLFVSFDGEKVRNPFTTFEVRWRYVE